MANPAYVFREEGDTENPHLARLYGLGITRGLDVVFKETPARVLTILCEGARFAGDTDVVGIRHVFYRGFEIPEFTNGVPNWKFHSGKMTKVPSVIKTVTPDHTTDKFLLNAHGLSNSTTGISYRLVSERKKSLGGAKLPAPLTDVLYYIVNATTNDFQLSLTVGGAPVTFTDNGGGPIRLIRADGGFDDPDQGRPHFWPDLDFTLSGIAYIEMQVPADYATDFEPEDMRYVMFGKKLQDFTVNPTTKVITLDSASTATESTNPALEALDFYINDAKIETTFDFLGLTLPRFKGPEWEAFRDRCDEVIEWTSSGPIEGVATYPTSQGAAISVTAATGALSKATSGDGAVYTRSFPNTETDFYIEITLQSGLAKVGFNENNTASVPVNEIALQANPDGKLYRFQNGAFVQIGTWAPGDRLKVAFEARVVKGYQNGNAVALSINASNVTYYGFVSGYNGYAVAVSSSRLFPVTAAPVAIKRFESHVVYTAATLVQDAVDGLLRRTPGVIIQDVNGALKPLTDMARATVYQFQYDPAGSVESNIVAEGVSMFRTPTENRPNFYRAVIRDAIDPFLKQVPIFEDRDDLRTLNNVGLIDSGLLAFGVMNQSQATRTLKAQARQRSDFPIWGKISAFFDSYVAAQGDYVELADDVPGYDIGTPVLFIVTEESSNMETVPRRDYTLQITTKTFYSDTDHGPAVPAIPPISNDHLRPAPLVTDIALTNTARQIVDGSWAYSLEGVVTFAPFDGQRARIFAQSPQSEVVDVSYLTATDIFTIKNNPFSNDDAVVFVDGVDAVPSESDFNTLGRIFFVINATGDSFQISETIGGSAFTLSTNFSIRCHVIGVWEPTGDLVVPDINSQAAFSVTPASVGVYNVKAITENRVGASFPFDAHLTYSTEIVKTTIEPLPPTNMKATFDGQNVTWTWDPSPSLDVVAYHVRDEFDRLIQIVTLPRYTEARTSEPVLTRRVYAVTSVGAVSTTYATFSFVIPFRFQWKNAVNVTINDDHTLTVSGTGSTYRGATLGTVALVKPLKTRVYLSPNRNDRSQGIALDNARTWFPDAFYTAVYFNADGTFGTFPANTSFGSYNGGDEFVLEIDPTANTIKLFKRVASGRTITETLIHSYGAVAAVSHFYIRGFTSAGVSNVIDLRPIVVGNLTDDIEQVPKTAQNVTNATYSNGTATRTSGSAWNTSGLSISKIPANQGGGFYFLTPGASGTSATGVSVGLCDNDSDQNITSQDFRIVVDGSGGLEVFTGSTSLAYFANPAASGSSPLIGVEYLFVGRQANGAPYVAVDDEIIYTHTAASSAMKDNDIFFDIAFNGSLGAVWAVNEIVMIAPYTTLLTPDGDFVSSAVALAENARAGYNNIYSIPPFVITTPVNGDYLRFNANGEVVNQAGGLSIGTAITGGGAYRVLHQDASQNLASDATFRYEASKLGIGLSSTPSARLHVRSTTEQLRLDYDASNRVSFTVSATGRATIDGAGSDYGLTINNTVPDANRTVFAITGTSSANNKIHSYIGVTPSLSNASGGTNNLILVNPTGDLNATTYLLRLQHTNVDKFRVDALGKIMTGGSFVGNPLSGSAIEFAPHVGAYSGSFDIFKIAATQESLVGTVALMRFSIGGSDKFAVLANGDLSVGHGSPSAALHVIKTSEQVRIGYDASNYYKTTVDSIGGVTFDAFGTGASFTFADKVVVNYATIWTPNTTSLFVGSNPHGSYSGLANTVIGLYAGDAAMTSNGNTIIGYDAGGVLTSGGNNTLIGYSAGQSLVSGGNNLIIGSLAGTAYTGDSSCFLGHGAGNVATGSGNTFVGSGAGGATTTGYTNTYIGQSAGYSTAVGAYENTAVGSQAGQTLQGNTNTLLGRLAGFQCTSGNVMIGYGAGFSETGSNKLIIHNSSSGTPFIYGEFDNKLIYVNAYTWRQRYDTSNYMDITVSSAGQVTINAVGSGSKFIFSDAVEVPGDSYSTSWSGNASAPQKNDVYNAIKIRPYHIGQFFSNVSPSGTGSDDSLYSNTVFADTLVTNGDALKIHYAGSFAANGNTKRLKIDFAGTNIFDSGALANASIVDWDIEVTIIRETSTTARAVSRFVNNVGAVVGYATITTGLNFATDESLVLKGNATTATTDITAKMATVEYWPAS